MPLVLARELNEEVEIWCPDGTVITIAVNEFRGTGKVRLAFIAPDDYKIHRKENADKMRHLQPQPRQFAAGAFEDDGK